ncbi:MAG: hypothetical protein GXP32_04470 [Kiritimatiellaeota bacterium]|nr:hypothetical protein [Kiritimatiellota bacterium]
MLNRTNITELVVSSLLLTAAFGLHSQEKLVVFDGGAKKEGKAWAHPRGMSSLVISWQHPFSNATHLDFTVVCQRGWAGAGWNWASWKGDGVDLSGYKNLVFRIGLSDDPVKDIFVQLTSKHPSRVDALGPKVEILPLIEKRKKYVMISIPLEKLFGGNLDPKRVWGINFNVFGAAVDTECRIYIDQIEFTK